MKYSIRAKPERIEVIDGCIHYFKYGKLIYIIESDGIKYYIRQTNNLRVMFSLWYLEGKEKIYCLHREDGPAIEHPDGTKEYYLDGLRFNIIIKKTNKFRMK